MPRRWLLGSADSNSFRVRRRCIRRHAGDGCSGTFDLSPDHHHNHHHVVSAFLVLGGFVAPSNSNTAAADDMDDGGDGVPRRWMRDEGMKTHSVMTLEEWYRVVRWVRWDRWNHCSADKVPVEVEDGMEFGRRWVVNR